MKLKRCFTIILAISIILSSYVGVYAKQEDKQEKKSTKEIIRLSDMKKKDAEATLAEYGIELPTEEGISENNEVVYGDLVLEYVDTSSVNDNQLMSVRTSSLSGSQIRIAYVEKQVNSDWKQINSSSKGMAYWLDVTFNLVIGTKTEQLWKAATILGVNPSNFFTSYKRGDYLAESHQKIYYYRCVQVCPSSTWKTLVSSQKISVYIYNDLRTTNTSGAAVHENGSKYKGYYADHYFDEDYLLARARELYDTYGLVVIENYYVD